MKIFKVLFFFILIYFPNHVFAQDYRKSVININEIEKGIFDFDYFRAVLLENDFLLLDTLTDSRSGEVWGIPIKYGNELERKFGRQISIQLINNKTEVDHIQYVKFSIRRDLLPSYSNDLQNMIRSNYENKSAKKIDFNNNGIDSPMYEINYSTFRNRINVSVENDGSWTKVGFIVIDRFNKDKNKSKSNSRLPLPTFLPKPSQSDVRKFSSPK